MPLLRLIAKPLCALAVATCATIAFAADDEGPSVTPYRPSVSTPAALSEPGWVEAEFGGIRTHAAGAHVDALPYTLKLAFSPDWGVRLGGNLWVKAVDNHDASLSGGGDTSIVLKRRFALDDAAAFGLEAGVSLPTATTGLGSGGHDQMLNGIYSTDLPHGLHTDLNVYGTRFGADTPGVSRHMLGWAASLSGNLDEHWGAGAELSGTHQGGAGNSTQLLGSLSYSPSKRVAFDGGVARSEAAGQHGWSVFAGVTVLMAKLF